MQTAKPLRNTKLFTKLEKTKHFIANGKARNTSKAYRSDLQDFVDWCRVNGLNHLPAEPSTVALYITDLAERGRRTSTIRRRLSAIKMLMESSGFENPAGDQLVKATMAGIYREKGSAPNHKKPLLMDEIKKMMEELSSTLIGQRDRALLLLGFAGAFRRSELVALNLEDVDFNKAGLIVTMRRSKTDQKGEGYKKGIPYGSNIPTCPVRVLQNWLEQSKINSGALFRSINKSGVLQESRLSDRDVARILKRVAHRAGLNPDDFSAHSLRSGFATQAAINLARFDKIMDQGGWKSELTVKRYIRDGNLFRENAAAKLGL